MSLRYDLTLIQVEALRTMLADQFDDDERGWLDALEGQTDAFELTARLAARIEAEDGTIAALTEQLDARKVRRDRAEARKAAARDAIAAVMTCAGIDKLPLPEATITLRETPAKLAVAIKEAVPDEYCTFKPTPSMERIKAAFSVDAPDLPNWLTIEPARSSLTIRRR